MLSNSSTNQVSAPRGTSGMIKMSSTRIIQMLVWLCKALIWIVKLPWVILSGLIRLDSLDEAKIKNYNRYYHGGMHR